MFRKISLAFGAGIMALSAPITAQESAMGEDASAAEMGAAMGEMFGMNFTADPLTEEQQQRLPLARRVVLQTFPDGTYAKMMEESLKPMFDGMLGGALGDGASAAQLAALSSKTPLDIMAMEKAEREEAYTLLDPAFAQRKAAYNDAIFGFTKKLMMKIEPAYREGLVRAYAKRFEVAELEELERFFSTPIGGKYAGESMLIYADPQVMEAMNDMVPAMMELIPEMASSFEEMETAFPEPRTFGSLSEGEQERLAELLGASVEQMQENEAATVEEWEDEWEEEIAEDAAEAAVE